MKKYRFGTPWSDWAWDLVRENKIIISNSVHNGPFSNIDENIFFFVYGKENILIAHLGDYLIQENNNLYIKGS